MDRLLKVDPRHCIGCRTCELACAFAHGQPGQPGTSRIRVYPTGPDRYIPLLCLQCDQAACVQICPTAALTRNEATGAIELYEPRCIRCRLCVVACPFGNLHVDARTGQIGKCDLCSGDPACARFCPTRTLRYRGVDEPEAEPHDRPGCSLPLIHHGA